jgi:hypothetical protein
LKSLLGSLLLASLIPLSLRAHGPVQLWSVSINLLRLALACNVVSRYHELGVIGFSLGAITGKRGMAGAVAGSLAFVSYLVTNLTPSVKQLKSINTFSPYQYFNKPSILDYGVRGKDLFILLSITLFFVVIGYLVFIKRDIAHQ